MVSSIPRLDRPVLIVFSFCFAAAFAISKGTPLIEPDRSTTTAKAVGAATDSVKRGVLPSGSREAYPDQ